MKVNKLAYILFLVLGTSSLMLKSQSKYSNEFLHLGVSAKGLSLANTQVAMVDDVSAAYWNPAGLVHLKQKYQFALMHAAYFAGIANYDYAGLAFRLDDKQSLGITAIRRVPAPNTPTHRNKEYNYTRIIMPLLRLAFLLSYARNSRWKVLA